VTTAISAGRIAVNHAEARVAPARTYSAGGTSAAGASA